ncbi:STBD1 protein, partial [Polyodon spathula]|nr:STBD1 protein [Polyodon spathula]
MPQNVSVSFRVHYITCSPFQLIAVTGNHRELGNWENYVPLRQDKDGFWCNSITLPADVKMEWKFVMVENGKIKRWEECLNRCLETTHDIQAHKWWGCRM